MKLVENFIIPKATGRAFVVQKGQVLRITQPEGPQVVDLNAFNAERPREHLGSSVTRSREGIHVSVDNRLWSCQPWERPMFTITQDTVQHGPLLGGARSHDFLLGRCSRRRRIERYGSDTPGCQEILATAIEAFGLAEDYVHDPFNVFMKTGLDERGMPYWEESDAKKGDHIDLRAEMSCIVAISACPGQSSGLGACPVGIEIYAPLSG